MRRFLRSVYVVSETTPGELRLAIVSELLLDGAHLVLHAYVAITPVVDLDHGSDALRAGLKDRVLHAPHQVEDVGDVALQGGEHGVESIADSILSADDLHRGCHISRDAHTDSNGRDADGGDRHIWKR